MDVYDNHACIGMSAIDTSFKKNLKKPLVKKKCRIKRKKRKKEKKKKKKKKKKKSKQYILNLRLYIVKVHNSLISFKKIINVVGELRCQLAP